MPANLGLDMIRFLPETILTAMGTFLEGFLVSPAMTAACSNPV